MYSEINFGVAGNELGISQLKKKESLAVFPKNTFNFRRHFCSLPTAVAACLSFLLPLLLTNVAMAKIRRILQGNEIL
jgi:hypothetical protein